MKEDRREEEKPKEKQEKREKGEKNESRGRQRRETKFVSPHQTPTLTFKQILELMTEY